MGVDGLDNWPISMGSTGGMLPGRFTCACDDDFRLNQMAYAGGAASYTYDADGFPTGSGVFTTARMASNGLPEAVTGGSLNLSRSFNGYGEQEGEALTVISSAVSSLTLTRDKAGRIVSKTETMDGATSELAYTYDPAGRLLTATKDGTPVEDTSTAPTESEPMRRTLCEP